MSATSEPEIGTARIHQEEILEAAALCFMERGYNASSIDDVARRLGSTKGRIYHHYRSKADLFADVYRYGMELNAAAIKPLCRAYNDPVEKLKAMAKVHCLTMLRTRPFQRCVWEGVSLLMRGATTPEQRETLVELQGLRESYAIRFREVIEGAKESGKADFESSGIATQIFLMALNSPIFWYSPRDTDDDEQLDEIASRCTRFALQGLGIGKEYLQDV